MMQLMRMDTREGFWPRKHSGRATKIAEIAIMNTNERRIRLIFLSGFLAVLVIEVWLLFRALVVFL